MAKLTLDSAYEQYKKERDKKQQTAITQDEARDNAYREWKAAKEAPIANNYIDRYNTYAGQANETATLYKTYLDSGESGVFQSPDKLTALSARASKENRERILLQDTANFKGYDAGTLTGAAKYYDDLVKSLGEQSKYYGQFKGQDDYTSYLGAKAEQEKAQKEKDEYTKWLEQYVDPSKVGQPNKDMVPELKVDDIPDSQRIGPASSVPGFVGYMAGNNVNMTDQGNRIPPYIDPRNIAHGPKIPTEGSGAVSDEDRLRDMYNMGGPDEAARAAKPAPVITPAPGTAPMAARPTPAPKDLYTPAPVPKTVTGGRGMNRIADLPALAQQEYEQNTAKGAESVVQGIQAERDALQTKRNELFTEITQLDEVIRWAAPSPQDPEAYREYIATQQHKQQAEQELAAIDEQLKPVDQRMTEAKDQYDILALQEQYAGMEGYAPAQEEYQRKLDFLNFRTEWNKMLPYERVATWFGDQLKEGYFLGQDKLHGAYDAVFENLGLDKLPESDWIKQELAKVRQRITDQAVMTGDDVRNVGAVISGSVAAIPELAVALATGGMSLAVSAPVALSTAGASFGANILQAIKNMILSPAFVSSYVSEFGATYNDERAKGSTPQQAAIKSMYVALPNSMIEVGGGFQNLIKNPAYGVVRSALEEGGEELAQGIVTRAMGAANSGKDIEQYKLDDIISWDNPEAIISGKQMVEEAAMGAAVGLVLSGGTAVANTAIDTTGRALTRARSMSVIQDYTLKLTEFAARFPADHPVAMWSQYVKPDVPGAASAILASLEMDAMNAAPGSPEQMQAQQDADTFLDITRNLYNASAQFESAQPKGKMEQETPAEPQKPIQEALDYLAEYNASIQRSEQPAPVQAQGEAVTPANEDAAAQEPKDNITALKLAQQGVNKAQQGVNKALQNVKQAQAALEADPASVAAQKRLEAADAQVEKALEVMDAAQTAMQTVSYDTAKPRDYAEGLDEETAKAMSEGAQATEMDKTDYSRAFRMSYELGAAGIGATVLDKAGLTKAIGEAAAKAHALGLPKHEANMPELLKRATDLKAKMPKPGHGKATYDPSVKLDNLTDDQKDQGAFLDAYAKAMGYNIIQFESTADKDGNFVDASGRPAPNGYFLPGDGTIHIDINAGRAKSTSVAKVLMPLTAGHEITHYLQEAAPELYAQYATLVLDMLAESGSDINRLMDGELALTQHGKVPYGVALDNVIANASQFMLQNTKAPEMIARKHPKLSEVIRAWVKSFTERVKAAFSGVDVRKSSVGALTHKGDKGVLEYNGKLQELWDTMSVEAASRPKSVTKAAPVVRTEEAVPAAASVRVAEASAPVQKPSSTGITYTPDNKPVNFHYALVPAGDLIASKNVDMTDNPNFPAELQPRDRDRASSVEQIRTIAKTLNPERLGASADVSAGSPLVGKDNVVEVGNGRVVAITTAMNENNEGAQKYRKWLKDNAEQFGLDPADVKDDSILVRVRDTEVNRESFVDEANEHIGGVMSGTEVAKRDAKKITTAMLELAAVGDIGSAANHDFISAFFSKVVPATEMGTMMDDKGKLSTAGEARIRNALFQLAYGDAYLTAQLAESADVTVQNIIKAMTNVAPRIALMNEAMRRKQLLNMPIGKEIAEAYKVIERVKLDGSMTLDEYFSQTKIIEDKPEQAMLLEVYDEYKRSPLKMTDALDNVLDVAERRGDINQVTMFEGATPSMEEVIREGLADFRKDQVQKFSERELDAEYIDAVKAGDMEKAQKMVNAYAAKRGYDADNSYRMEHGAPENDGFSKPIHDMTAIYPADFYEKGAEYYGSYSGFDAEAMMKLRKVKGKPEARIWMYRAVPADVKGDDFRNGDWITITRDYAQEHGKDNISGPYRIIAKAVLAKDVYTNADSIQEYGYDDGKSYAYGNTKNNRKSLAPVTYEYNGSIIPLSKRFNKRAWETRYQEREYAPPMYSKMQQEILSYKGDKIGAEGLIKYLQGRGVKADEIRWSGIQTYLQGKKSVTKAELLMFGLGSELRVEDITYEGDKDAKYGDWKLYGGKNYRELLFTLPDFNATFRSGHWDEDNVFAETRVQDFETTTGKRVLFLDEVQSDWHQEGRDKGYAKEPLLTIGEYKPQGNGVDIAEVRDEYENLIGWIMPRNNAGIPSFTADYGNGQRIGTYNSQKEALDALSGMEKFRFGEAPEAPFAKTWHEYVLKRVLRMAAEGNYDYVAWTTGQMQADRYNLETLVKGVVIKKNAGSGTYNVNVEVENERTENDISGNHNAERIIELFGKDIGSRMIRTADTLNGKPYEMSGLDLKIGGDGMRAFYDIGGKGSQNIPRFLSKYGAQWGAGISEIKIRKGRAISVPAIEVNDRMKQSVLYQGQPLYQERSGYIENPNRDTLNNIKMRGDTVAITKQDVMSHIIQAMNSKEKKRVYFSAIGEKAKSRIAKDIGIDIFKSGQYALGFTYDSARHIRDHFSADPIEIYNSIMLLTEIVTNYDGVEYVVEDYGERKLVFTRGLTAADYLSVNIPSKSARSLDLKSMYITKKGKEIGAQSDRSAASKDGTQAGSLSYTDIIPTDTDVSQPLSQDRSSTLLSKREILASAFEDIAKSDGERRNLKEYKRIIGAVNRMETEAAALREQNTAERRKKADADKGLIEQNTARINEITERIDAADRRLLRMQNAAPLQNIIKREGDRIYKEAREKNDRRMEEYRERINDTSARGKRRRQIIDGVKKLDGLLRNESDKKHIPEGFKKAVLDFLEIFTDNTSVFDYKRLARVKEVYDALSESGSMSDTDLAGMYDYDISQEIADAANTMEGKRLSELDEAQLDRLKEITDHLNHIVSNENQLWYNGRKETVSGQGDQGLQEYGEKAKKEQLSVLGGHNPVAAVHKLLTSKNVKPAYFFKHVGGVMQKHFDGVREGQNKWAFQMNDSRKFFLTTTAKYNYYAWADKAGDALTFKTLRGDTITLTRDQALELYAIAKREATNKQQKADHLGVGGFVYDTAVKVKKRSTLGVPMSYDVNVGEAHPLSEGDIEKVSKWLTPQQRGFADEMVNYLSTTMGEYGNQVSMALYGVRKYTEGYYFPYKSASNYLYNHQGGVQDDSAIKHRSFTKKTTVSANNPVVLSGFTKVWADHVQNMNLYSTMALPLDNFNRVYNYRVRGDKPKEGETAIAKTQSIKAVLEAAYGKEANAYIKQLLNDVNGGIRPDKGDAEARKLISLWKKGAVFASMSVVVQQPSAIGRAMALVDIKYFRKGYTRAGYDEMMKWSGVANIKRMGRFDANMGMTAADWLTQREYTGMAEKAKAFARDGSFRDDVLAWLPQKADEMTWTALWEAVKRETAASHGNMIGSDAFMQKVAERFNEVVEYTQVYDSVLSRSEIMRSQSTLAQMVTSFMAEPTTAYNMLLDSLVNRKNKGIRNYVSPARALGAFVATVMLNSILKAMVTAGRDDDDKYTWLEKYLRKVAEGLFDEMNPLGMVPYGRDILSLWDGYDIERADMSVIGDVIDAAKKMGKPDLSIMQKLDLLAGAVGNAFGVPYKNVRRDIQGVYNTLAKSAPMATQTATGVAYSLMEGVPWFDASRAGYSRRLYSAIINKDTKAEADMRLMLSKVATKDELVRSDLKKIIAVELEEERLEPAAALQQMIDIAGLKQVKGEIGNWYKAGQIGQEEAEKLLIQFTDDDQSKERYDTIEGWDFRKNPANEGASYSTYKTFYDAVESGTNLRAVIGEYTDARKYGATKATLSARITDNFKEKFVDLYKTDKTKAAALKSRLLTAYALLGYDRAKKSKEIDAWLKP